MAEFQAQRQIELLSGRVGAVLAHACCVVDEITRAAAREKWCHVFATVLSWRRGECAEFV